MASDQNINEELERANAVRRSMGEKYRKYVRGQNLTRDGGGKDEGAAARKAMRGVNVSKTPAMDIPIHAHITGKTTKYKKVKAQDWGHDDDLSGANEKGVAITKLTRLAVPIVRPIRAATPDGVTSFHFSHEAITKTATERVSDSGSKTRPGSARDHSRYLERETALARDEEGVVERLENETETEPKTESEIEADEIKKAFGQAEAGSVYIERQEALAVNTNGVAVLYSNIAESAAERRKFWSLVEEHERQPGADTMRVRMDANFDMWTRVLADPACPEAVKETLTKADPDLEVRIQTDSNEAMRRLMMRHGWTPPKRQKREETTEERESREKQEDKQSGVIFEDARGGRIQFRMIGELPHETDHEGRVRILRGMAQEFEKRNLPYMAVMHAPDHTNNDKNWHFHLIYHDRPANRFVNDPEHPSNAHLYPNPMDPLQTAAMKAEALDRLGNSELNEHVGKWDFTVPMQKRKKSRHTLTRHPFGQDKDREPTRRPFIPMLRKRLADLTNEELERVGSVRRLDPRRYSEIGIDRSPDLHLGTKLSQHEEVGIPTGIGKLNEQNQWNFIMGGIQREQEKREQELKGDVSQMRNNLSATAPEKVDADLITSAIIGYEQNKRAANEHEIIARYIEEHYWRAQSRAHRLEKTSEKHLKAIKDGKASSKVKKHEQDYRAKLAEARDHLAGIDHLMAAEIRQIATSREIAARLTLESDQHRSTFEQFIKEVRKKKGMSELSAESENQRRPANANNGETARKDVGLVNEWPGAGDEAKGPLTREEMDAYIATIMKENVRLVVRNRLVVPKVVDPRFANIVTAPNYRIMMPRLTGIHSKQNETLSALLEVIDGDPKIIQIGRDSQGRHVPILKTADKALQAAFKYFGDERRVIMAVDAAMASTGLRIDAQPIAASKPEAGKTQVPETQPAAPAAKAPAKPANDIGSIIVREVAARRLSAIDSVDITGSIAVLTLSRPAAQRLGVEEQVEITAAQAKKLQNAMRYSERERARLAAYIAKAPQAVKITDNAIELPSTAPEAIRLLAANHSKDPERLQPYRIGHRQALEQQAEQVATKTPKTGPIDTQRQAPAMSSDAPRYEPAPAPIVDDEPKPAAVTPTQPVAAPEPAQDENRVAASTPVQGRPATDAPDATEGTFDLSRPTAPAPRDTAEKKPTRGGQAPSLPANEQEDDLPRIRSLGTRSVLASDPSTNPELRDKSPGVQDRRPIPQQDLFDMEAERARIRAGKVGTPREAKELRRGLHPSIDKWIEAREQDNEKLRQLAAEEIQGNQRARRIAKQLSEEEQGRIREDARLAREAAERRDGNERSQGRGRQQDFYQELYRKGDDES
ncbi:MAG: hypothetical protein DI591_10855 [Citromicrobium sp.]|nr:MAG: hypothetical protein DI591_10855 [Citromicrobium sp.]